MPGVWQVVMVEAAGVEPAISVENTQLTDSENASIAENATIFISSVQITYKDFPELQNFQASTALAQHAEVLFNVYTSIMGRWGISLNYLLWENPQTLSADSGPESDHWPQVGLEPTICRFSWGLDVNRRPLDYEKAN